MNIDEIAALSEEDKINRILTLQLRYMELESDMNKVIASKKKLEDSIIADNKRVQVFETELGEALFRNEERYRELFDNVPIALYQGGDEGEFVNVNARLVEILGVPDKKSLMGTRILDLYTDDIEREYLEKTFREADFEYTAKVSLRRHDGQIIWVMHHIHYVDDGKGNIIAWLNRINLSSRNLFDERQIESLRYRGGFNIVIIFVTTTIICHIIHDSRFVTIGCIGCGVGIRYWATAIRIASG